MSDEEYEVGTEMTPAMLAFIENEGGESPPAPPKQEVAPDPVADPVEDEPPGEAEIDDPADPAPADPDPVDPVSSEDLELAQSMGWSPKEEWRGDPEKWVDHKTFLDRANNPKVWRERYQKLDREAKRNIEQVQQATQRIIARDRETLRQRYQAEYRRLESERDDWIRYHAERGEADQATQKLHEYEQALQKTNNDFRTEVAQTQQQAPPAEAVAWRQNRPFDTDPEFAQAASFHASRVDKEMPDAPVSERLARIDEILAKRFPEHYPDAAKPADPPPKPKAPPADARQPDGVRMTPGGQTRSYASQLSAVERQMGQGFVKDGLYKNLEAYAKVLKAPESEDA